MAWYRLYALLSVCVAFLLATATGWSQSLTWLGTLGGSESWATGVSADGSVVVGWADTAGYWRAFRWTASGGMQDLGTLPGGDWSEAYGVSADGSVVVGVARNAAGQVRAFRWTASGGMQDLGTLPGGARSAAYGVSADGSVVVGVARNAAGDRRAFRWTASGGMQDLGTLGAGESWATGVSADGSVVVGRADNAAGRTRAFRWTASGGMQDLGTLPGGDWSEAYGVSADGSVVVGRAYNFARGYWRAFRWTASGGMQNLGTLSCYGSEAYGVSADGSVVVGTSDGQAFRWTASGGMEDLNTTYASLLTDGSWLWEARAISPNGRYILGRGWNAATNRYEPFLLDTRKLAVIRGTLTLGDYGGDPSLVPVSVRLRKEGGSEETRTIFTDRNGNYSLWLEPGTYEVSFKASHWLRVNLTGVTLGVAEELTGQNVTLTNGDIDGDNEVTLFDFGELVAAFGSMPGDENWNPNADLDGDEEVTLFDFGILVQNFGAIGDE
jgi:probable HAF family extracellular repeat protein